MSLRSRNLIALVLTFIAIATAVSASPASARSQTMISRSGITLTVPNLVQVNWTSCADSRGNPLPCITVPYTVTNGNMVDTANCSAYFDGFAANAQYFSVWPASTAPSNTAGGSMTTPYNGQKVIYVELSCTEPHAHLAARIRIFVR